MIGGKLIKRILLILTFFGLWVFYIYNSYAENSSPSSPKDIFYTVKGPHGSCNTCHPNGGTAGRWDSEYNEISEDGDKIIPSLKGVGKRKTPEQIEKAIKVVSTRYKIPVNDSQIKALVEYVSGL